LDKKHQTRLILGSVVLAMAIPGGLVYRRYRYDMKRAYHRISRGAHTIETACGPIQYTEFGEGAPMLIVHGAGGGYDQGKYFAKLIGGNYRWIAPSRFGFLGTPMPDGADSELQAEAYACLLDSLGIERVGVIGISMGGPSSLLFALRFPQRTKSLAMISAASHAIPARPALLASFFNIFLNDFVFWSLVHLSPAVLLAALGVPLDVQQQLSAQEVKELSAFLASIVPMSARKTGQLFEQHMSEFEAEQIRNIRAPTLVLHARDDTLVSCEQAEFTARNIPGAQFIPMEKGGHLGLMFNINSGAKAKLQKFLERYNSR
jgi:2-hydroxy-6-oxonona-2,4-dienedioate hydrolase